MEEINVKLKVFTKPGDNNNSSTYETVHQLKAHCALYETLTRVTIHLAGTAFLGQETKSTSASHTQPTILL